MQEFPKPDGSERAAAPNPTGTFLYVTEFQNSGSGLYYLAEFSIVTIPGALTYVTSIQVPNSGGIMVDPTGSVFALAGSLSVPTTGNPQLAMYKIGTDGSLTAAGAPIPLFGQQVQDFLFDASGQNFYVLSNQSNPATSGSSLQSFRIDNTTGSATLVQSIPLSIDTTKLAVAGSKYVYLSGVGTTGNDIAGWSIQSDVAPITGTPFGSVVSAYGLAASHSGTTIYASDLQHQNLASYSVSFTGTLALGGTTAPNELVPASHMAWIAAAVTSTAQHAIPVFLAPGARSPSGRDDRQRRLGYSNEWSALPARDLPVRLPVSFISFASRISYASSASIT